MEGNNRESRRSFITKSAVAAAALGITGFIPLNEMAGKEVTSENIPSDAEVLQHGRLAMTLKAGFAETDISPRIGMEMPGDYRKMFHEKTHDPCKARAVVFDDGIRRVALIGIDALMIHEDLVKEVRKEIEDKCGISAQAVMIGASHSHSSGPLGMVQPGEYDHANTLVKSLAYEKSSCADPEYLKMVKKKLIEAVCQADQSRVEVTSGVDKGHEDKVAFNRRFLMKNGLSYTHPGQLNPEIVKPAGPIDPEVGVIGVWNKEGKCLGCIVNYACHATCNPGGISANWIYYLEQTIRGAMGPDCVVVFLQGACGDITQVNNLNIDVNLKGEDWARFVGGRVGAEVVKVLLSMPRGELVPLDAKSTVAAMKRRAPSAQKVKKAYETVEQTPEAVGTTEWTFAKEIVLLDAKIKKETFVDVEVQAVQVGSAVFISNPAEFFCELGLKIKSKSPFPFTFPVELANGCVGYVPTEEAFGPHGGGYETRLTSYSNLEITAGNKMIEMGLGLAKKMKPGLAPKAPEAPAFSGSPWEYGQVKPELE